MVARSASSSTDRMVRFCSRAIRCTSSTSSSGRSTVVRTTCLLRRYAYEYEDICLSIRRLGSGGSGSEAGQDEVADAGGVGLATGGLHDRADQGARRGNLALADLGGRLGVGRDGLVDGGVERALV